MDASDPNEREESVWLSCTTIIPVCTREPLQGSSASKKLPLIIATDDIRLKYAAKRFR